MISPKTERTIIRIARLMVLTLSTSFGFLATVAMHRLDIRQEVQQALSFISFSLLFFVAFLGILWIKDVVVVVVATVIEWLRGG